MWMNRIKRAFVGIIFIVLGIGLVLYGFKDSIKSSVLRGDVDREVSSSLQEALSSSGEKDSGKDALDTEWILPDSDHKPNTDRDENKEEYASVGALIMPSLGKTLAIMDGFGGNNLFRGASEQFYDQEMGVGNYVLSSHWMYDGTLFGDLEEVSVLDEVYVTDYDKVWKYKVIDSDNEVETTRTHLLEDTEESVLTIYGCTEGGKMRVVKRASLVGYSNIEDLSAEDKTLLDIKNKS